VKIKLIGAVLGLSLLGISAQARLGMTLKECTDKYGDSTTSSSRLYPQIYNFKVNQIAVTIVFKSDVSVRESYHRIAGIEPTEIQALLDKNADNGAVWGLPEKHVDGSTQYALWYLEQHNDWVARVEYDATGPNHGTLIVQTKAEFYAREQDKKHDGI
jgi:hypothetical protein